MTPLPKKKMSRARSLKRKGQLRVKMPTLSICPQCKKTKLPHIVCPNCGYYKDGVVVATKSHTKAKVIKES